MASGCVPGSGERQAGSGRRCKIRFIADLHLIRLVYGTVA